MRIGFEAKRIFHNHTGLGNYGRDIVRILTDQKATEHFYLFNTKKSEFEKEVYLQKATIIYPKGWFWNTFPSIWRLMGQWKQAKSLCLDCYHGLSGEIPLQLKKNRIPKIVTIHDLIFLSHPQYYNFFDRLIYRLKIRYAVQVANHIVAISEQTKADIIKYFKVNENKISVVYQGCNEAYKQTYSKEEWEKTKKKFHLPDSYILNVGTIQDRKNALSVVKAIKDTDHYLVLVGKEKSYAKKIHQYIAAHDLGGRVIFIKNVESTELAMIYKGATVFCYPSFCEGFGIPIIEALFSKIPVITTKFGCFPEAAGPSSLFIDPRNIEEIRAAINHLYNHPEIREKMAMEGYAYAQRFSDAQVAKNLLQLYKKMNHG